MRTTLTTQSLPARITFISHAATAATRHTRFPLDEAVDEAELDKLRASGWRPPRAQRCLVAPEQRARQTAEVLGFEPVSLDALREIDYGAWAGLPFEQTAATYPDDVGQWLGDAAAAPHGGESIAQLIERIGLWLDRQRPEGHTIAVTHSSVIRAALLCALGAPAEAFWRMDIAPASWTDLRHNGRAWTMRAAGVPLRASLAD